MIKLENSKIVRAPLGLVYEWWTDFREDDPSLSGKIVKSRRIINRTPTAVEFEDEGRMLTVSYRDHVKVTLMPPDRWTAEYLSNRFKAYSTYSLSESPSGTLLKVQTEVQFKGVLAIFGPFVKRLIERTISKEWDDFARLIEEDYSENQPKRKT